MGVWLRFRDSEKRQTKSLYYIFIFYNPLQTVSFKIWKIWFLPHQFPQKNQLKHQNRSYEYLLICWDLNYRYTKQICFSNIWSLSVTSSLLAKIGIKAGCRGKWRQSQSLLENISKSRRYLWHVLRFEYHPSELSWYLYLCQKEEAGSLFNNIKYFLLDFFEYRNVEICQLWINPYLFHAYCHNLVCCIYRMVLDINKLVS